MNSEELKYSIMGWTAIILLILLAGWGCGSLLTSCSTDLNDPKVRNELINRVEKRGVSREAAEEALSNK